VHLPDPDGSRTDPSAAFETFRERLLAVGIEPSWQRGYNAGANPISVRLTISDLEKSAVQDLLRASFEVLDVGTTPWSERQPESEGFMAGESRAAIPDSSGASESG
jgi:hypothetical protein